jgi:hypothetical protein
MTDENGTDSALIQIIITPLRPSKSPEEAWQYPEIVEPLSSSLERVYEGDVRQVSIQVKSCLVDEIIFSTRTDHSLWHLVGCSEAPYLSHIDFLSRSRGLRVVARDWTNDNRRRDSGFRRTNSFILERR